VPVGVIPRRGLPSNDPLYSSSLVSPIDRYGRLEHRPVLCVPGNQGEVAVFDNLAAHLLADGYLPDEIHTIRPPQKSGGPMYQDASRMRLTAVRDHMENVKRYTGAEQIDLISHSRGTADGIAAMQGGKHCDTEGCFELGEPLPYIHTFISIAGIYRGWLPVGLLAGLNMWNVFLRYPLINGVAGVQPGSDFLKRIQSRDIPALRTASMTSMKDEIVGSSAPMIGSIPGERRVRVFDEHSHCELVEATAAEQLKILHEEW
jgi:hypothetical protein